MTPLPWVSLACPPGSLPLHLVPLATSLRVPGCSQCRPGDAHRWVFLRHVLHIAAGVDPPRVQKPRAGCCGRVGEAVARAPPHRRELTGLLRGAGSCSFLLAESSVLSAVSGPRMSSCWAQEHVRLTGDIWAAEAREAAVPTALAALFVRCCWPLDQVLFHVGGGFFNSLFLITRGCH